MIKWLAAGEPRTTTDLVDKILADDILELRGLHSHIGSQIFDSAGFEVAEDANLVVEASLGLGPAECLVHAAVVADPDDGALRVFDLVHGGGE